MLERFAELVDCAGSLISDQVEQNEALRLVDPLPLPLDAQAAATSSDATMPMRRRTIPQPLFHPTTQRRATLLCDASSETNLARKVAFQRDGIGDHLDVALPTRLRDPRRGGFLALAIATAYIVALFVNQRVQFKLAFGAGIAIVLVALVLVMPLPRWRDRSECGWRASPWWPRPLPLVHWLPRSPSSRDSSGCADLRLHR